MNDFWSWVTALVTTLLGIFVGHKLSLSRVKSDNILTFKNKFQAHIVIYVEYTMAYWGAQLETAYLNYLLKINGSSDSTMFEVYLSEKQRMDEYMKYSIIAKKDIIECITSLGNFKSVDVQDIIISIIGIDEEFSEKITEKSKSLTNTSLKKKLEKETFKEGLRDIIHSIEADYYSYFDEVKLKLEEKGI